MWGAQWGWLADEWRAALRAPAPVLGVPFQPLFAMSHSPHFVVSAAPTLRHIPAARRCTKHAHLLRWGCCVLRGVLMAAQDTPSSPVGLPAALVRPLSQLL